MELDGRLATQGDDLRDSAISRLQSEGFELFEASRGKRSESNFVFNGLSEFVACARALGIRIIFIEAALFDDDEFIVDDVMFQEEVDDEGGAVDLRDVQPKLRVFQKYVGTCQLVVLTGCAGSASISYYESAEWVEEFEQQRDQAVRLLRASSDEAEERHEREVEQRNKELLVIISKLTEDAKFNDAFSGTRPTQGAIVAYIRTTIDGAAELPSRMLREAANQLRDRILLKR